MYFPFPEDSNLTLNYLPATFASVCESHRLGGLPDRIDLIPVQFVNLFPDPHSQRWTELGLLCAVVRKCNWKCYSESSDGFPFFLLNNL